MLFLTFTAALFANAEGSVKTEPEPIYPTSLLIEVIVLEEVIEVDGGQEQPEPELPMRSDADNGDTRHIPQVNTPRMEPRAPAVQTVNANGEVTHYGASYNGNTMGCQQTADSRNRILENGGYGDRIYRSSDPSIAASAYDLNTGARPYACGALLFVSGQAGGIYVVVQDACPGCGWTHLDLSEEGITRVCGGLGRCQVRITVK